VASPRPQIIAHRGASGYLPEHTLVAKALAFAMGADYLEQDVVATRDGQLIVFHDLTLDEMTDVRARFPDRARPDGHYYCVDFSLEEVRSLSVTERRAAGGSGPRYPGRFPQRAGRFPIPTLDEEIRFIQGLAQSTGRSVGIYPEIKHPAWHRRHGIDLGAELLATLGRFGYTDARHDVFVQCFDPDELQRLRRDLGCRLRLVQLLEGQGDAPPRAALDRIAGYADAIGPSIRLLYRGRHPSDASPILTSLAGDARSAGLAVHPYTFRVDELPAGIDSFQDLLELFLVRMRVDGLFTDFPDVAARFVADRLPGR
jgi:glycerophosphoryl diester phosphodiesterase